MGEGKKMDRTAKQKIPKTRAFMAAVLAIFLLSGGCNYGPDGVMSLRPGASGEVLTSDTIEDAVEGFVEETLESAGIQVADLGLTIRESPVDTDRYDVRTDRIYKDAFLKAITGQTSIRHRDKEGMVSYRELLPDGEGMGAEEFLRAVRKSDYFYQDFDGDGLPELIVDTEGPCVLKYYPEEDQVELYHQKEPGWRLLGAGQMYADLSEPVDGSYMYLYHYESVGGGAGCQAFYYWSRARICRVTIDGQEYEYPVTDEETASQLKQAYIRMIKDAPCPMSFAALFGNGEEQGVFSGKTQPPRYLLEETAALPVNEETGEEWEMYKSMMEGDFSLVEDERWSILQSNYEDALEREGGRCNWSYLLMDFDQDGTKELVLRCDPDRVNTTAYFHYKDGHITMWEGGYMSADPHYYTVPLSNGRILGVDWYQDNKTWWIMRPDQQPWGFGTTKEKLYSKGSLEREEGEKEYCKFQDYYHDGKLCGSLVDLLPEEWKQVEDMVEGLLVPEEAWKPCSVFTPKKERPEIPGI